MILLLYVDNFTRSGFQDRHSLIKRLRAGTTGHLQLQSCCLYGHPFDSKVTQYELRRLAVQHSWTWSAKSEQEFFILVGNILNPISKSLGEVNIEWNLDDRVAIWAIYTEGLRQVMNRYTEK